jgi:hypothetical protein
MSLEMVGVVIVIVGGVIISIGAAVWVALWPPNKNGKK